MKLNNLILVIDEFPFLINSCKNVIRDLQYFIDELNYTKGKVIFLGSNQFMMIDIF